MLRGHGDVEAHGLGHRRDSDHCDSHGECWAGASSNAGTDRGVRHPRGHLATGARDTHVLRALRVAQVGTHNGHARGSGGCDIGRRGPQGLDIEGDGGGHRALLSCRSHHCDKSRVHTSGDAGRDGRLGDPGGARCGSAANSGAGGGGEGVTDQGEARCRGRRVVGAGTRADGRLVDREESQSSADLADRADSHGLGSTSAHAAPRDHGRIGHPPSGCHSCRAETSAIRPVREPKVGTNHGDTRCTSHRDVGGDNA
mmetsp:Transcript_20909/g.48891  ORF Transcript_20909/g.48891 Transcript_20909/m.48891 type:complete len:256 (+) Transcript_20909:2200-2967(+)